MSNINNINKKVACIILRKCPKLNRQSRNTDGKSGNIKLHKWTITDRTYASLGIQSLLLQLLTTRLNHFRYVFLSRSVRIETLHYCKVLERVPLQHPLLYFLPVCTQSLTQYCHCIRDVSNATAFSANLVHLRI